MKKQILLIFFLCFTIILQAQVTKTVNITAGGLTSTELTTVTNLTITGTIDARDFVTMNEATALKVIDLSGANIIAYTGTWGTAGINSNSYSANTIPHYAFLNCIKLTSITIPSSVTSIGDGAFEGCTGLTSITIPLHVTSIASGAFSGCAGLTSINIPSSVTSIASGAFSGCTRLTSIDIPSSVTYIGGGAFADCAGLTWIDIPSSVTSIGEEVFFSCNSLSSITIPSSVTSIGANAFEYCWNLISTTIPSSVDSIGNYAFSDCRGLTSINIPSSVTYIGSSAFSNCWDLTSITIPSSVISIGESAFSDCTGFKSIYSYAAIPIDLSLSSDVFNSVNKVTCTLYVPVGSKSAYKAANQWKDFANIVEMTTAISTITNSNISLYPNPITESFQINGFEGLATMTISDLNGKAILTKQVISNESISVGTLPKGMYILKVITNEGTIERKVVIK